MGPYTTLHLFFGFLDTRNEEKKEMRKFLVITLLTGDQNELAKGASRLCSSLLLSLKGTASSREQNLSRVPLTSVYPHVGSKILGTLHFDIYSQSCPVPSSCGTVAVISNEDIARNRKLSGLT